MGTTNVANMLSRVLVTLAAIALIASATPSEDLLRRAGKPIDTMSSHLQRVPAHLRPKDGQTPEQVVQLALVQATQNPETINTLTDALDTIIENFKQRFAGQQALLDRGVEAFSNCSQNAATVDPAAQQKLDAEKAKIPDAQSEIDSHSTGSLSFNFGDDPTSSSIERTTARLKIDKYKENFDKAVKALKTIKATVELSEEAVEELEKMAEGNGQDCQCAAWKGYEAVKKTAQEATSTIKPDLVHFSLIKCVMTQFLDKDEEAFETCMSKAKDKTLVDFDVIELDLKEDSVNISEETKEACDKTPAPTPPPTELPTEAKTFDTVLAGKSQEMVWAKYGKDQPTGQTLFGYGTGREIKLKRFVNMADVKGSLCENDQSRPDCRYKDKNMLYRVAKLEAGKNKNIKAFCINEDDVTYYLMSSVQSWVSIASRCPTEDEVLMIPNDKTETGKEVSDETQSFRWTKYLAPSEQCPGNEGCQWKKGAAPECQKAQATKGEWTCYKQYGQTDPDLCNKGGVCAGYGR